MEFTIKDVNGLSYTVSTKDGNFNLVRVTNLVDFFDHRKKQTLNNWKANNKDHQTISLNARNRGNKIHKFLEHHAKNEWNQLENVYSTFNLDEQKRIKHLKSEVLDYIDIVYSELKLIYINKLHSYGYAGTSDLFCKFKPHHKFRIDGLEFINTDSLYIGDWKAKDRACSNISYLLSYALQLAFYANAYKFLYEQEVSGGFIFYNSPNKTTLYYLSKENLNYFIDECLDILDCYHTKKEYDFESMKKRVGINTYYTKDNRPYEKLDTNHKLFVKVEHE